MCALLPSAFLTLPTRDMEAVEKEILMIPNMDGNERIFLNNVLGELDEDQKLSAVQLYRSKRKDPQIILILTLLGFIGIAGIHRFLLGQIVLGIVWFLTAGLCYIGTIIDLINYRSMTLEYNQNAAAEAVATVKVMSGSK